MRNNLIACNEVHYKSIFASCFGSIMEWYDFAVYGYFAAVFARIFFPSTNYSLDLIKAFSIFSLSFAARPLGSILFGYIGDKLGRRIVLLSTPLIMLTTTIGFILLPGYQSIGVYSPLLVTFLRITQGICIGGEFSHNLIYLYENANKNKKYFIGSLGSCTGGLGILFASALSALIFHYFTAAEITFFAWKYAYFLAAFLCLITFILRLRMHESPVYTSLKNLKGFSTKTSIKELFSKETLKNFFLAILITFQYATLFYFVFMFIPAYLNQIHHELTAFVLSLNSLYLAIALVITLLFGMAADQFGGKKMLIIAAGGVFFFTIPLFFILNQSNTKLIFNIVYFIFTLLVATSAGSLPGYLNEIIPNKNKCIIFSFSFNVCFGIFGGVVPMLSFYLIKTSSNNMLPAYYVAFSAILSLLGLKLIKNKKDVTVK